jgi:hypothetical protein
MTTDHLATALQTVVRVNDTKLFASLELSKSRWLVTVRACLKIQVLDKTGYFLSNAIPMAPAWSLLTSGSGFRQSDPEQRNQANSMT